MVEAIKKIQFNEELHRYTDEDNNVYTSVTTVIQNYYPKFDENYWAKKKAQELNTTPELIKASWKEGRDYACAKGNKEHKLIEDSINSANGKADFKFDRPTIGKGIIINTTNLHILANSPLAIKYPAIYKMLRKHIEDGWTLYAEKRVYWYDVLIAGTIDCLLIKGKLFMIVDWKTNKDELMFKSGYYKKINGIKSDIWVDKKEYFFTPLSYIENCKGNVYTIQLNLYAYILEQWGYKCIDLVLFHIRDNIEPKPYTIPQWRSACQLLFAHHKNALTQSRNTNKSTKSSTNFGIR